MRAFLIAATSVLLAVASGAHGANGDELNCRNWRSRANDIGQQGLNQCARRDFAKADALLNKTYREFVGKSDDNLRKAQRAWLAFRDAECAYQSEGEKGGSLWPLEHADCMTELTNQRIKQLRDDAKP